MIGNKILLASNQTSVAQTLSALALVSLLSGSLGTERIRIQCRAIVGSISGQDYYEFDVNVTQHSGLVWLRL